MPRGWVYYQCMNKTNIIVALTVLASASAFAETLAVGQNNKLDLAPLVVINQALPTLKVGADANKDNGVLNVSVSNGVGVNLPGVAASATLGTVSVGPAGLNVKAGNQNSVTVGPLTVGQALPSAQVGTGANKASWFDIRLSHGLGITLPFVSLNIPLPTIDLKKDEAKASVKAPAKK